MSQAAEHAHQKAVIAVLNAFDALKVQSNMPLRHAGVVVDVIARTENKQIVLETITLDTDAALHMGRRKVQHIKRATGAEHAYVVVPDGSEIDDQEGVLLLADVQATIQSVLDEPVFRGSALVDLGEDEDAPIIYAAMPYKLGFDDTYFLGVVDAALKVDMVVDRVDNAKNEDAITDGIEAAQLIVADLTGSDEHVINQLRIATETDKPIIQICEETQPDLPEIAQGRETIRYANIDALRHTLTERFSAPAP